MRYADMIQENVMAMCLFQVQWSSGSGVWNGAANLICLFLSLKNGVILWNDDVGFAGNSINLDLLFCADNELNFIFTKSNFLTWIIFEVKSCPNDWIWFLSDFSKLLEGSHRVDQQEKVCTLNMLCIDNKV